MSIELEDLDAELKMAASDLAEIRVHSLFSKSTHRHKHFFCKGPQISLDYSKHLLNETAKQILTKLADRRSLAKAFNLMIRGEEVNRSERRPALHTLLRGTGSGLHPEKTEEVNNTLDRMKSFVMGVHTGGKTGWTGECFTDVVNIGIGGSDLGPRLICDALNKPDLCARAHFVANIDPEDLDRTLRTLDPEKTLFVICSKSFSTEETLSNASRARSWLTAAGAPPGKVGHHLVAITSRIDRAVELDISPKHCFPVWDWVGGRYSLWSAVGLSIPLSIGWPAFRQLLDGAYLMDMHTVESSVEKNLPMTMALLEFWNTIYLQTETHVILPYSHKLRLLPGFLQQLTMESNGKRVSQAGHVLTQHSAPILWGSAGTIGQHSYFQLLHQGTRAFSADIILPLVDGSGDPEARKALASNALAQSQAFMVGRHKESKAIMQKSEGISAMESLHLEVPGNRSHSLILLKDTTPVSLGALIAAYEHKTFFLGTLLGINSFDQWGVELGKEINNQIKHFLDSGMGEDSIDPSTKAAALIWRQANSPE